MLFSKSDFSSELKKVVVHREDVVLVGLGICFESVTDIQRLRANPKITIPDTTGKAN